MPGEFHEHDVSFGPFKTEHHTRTVDARFRTAFIAFVRDRILPLVEGSFTRVEGKLYSNYDDPKYFGPLSVVRFRYFFELAFHSPDGMEAARGHLDYNSGAATFSEVPRQPPHVYSLSLQRRRKYVGEKIIEIAKRYREGERDMVCPICGSLISVLYLEKRDFIEGIHCQTKGCIAERFN